MIARALQRFDDLTAYQQRRACLGMLGTVWIAIILALVS